MPTEATSCPLCGGIVDPEACLGRLFYRDRVFSYQMCLDCRSGICHPMPDASLLSLMYGPDYSSCSDCTGDDDPKDPGRVLDWLRRTPRGLFVDFGCGRGELLGAARLLGWNVAGVEFEPSVARSLSERLALPVLAVADWSAVTGLGLVDVVHLGDVIEHLTRPQETIRSVLSMLRPGGILIAQGPLEAGPSFFAAAMQSWQRLARPAPRAMAPYHTLMATVVGQRRFFGRAGLEEIEYSVSEVAWPAPAQLARGDLARPRRLALWALRRVSQALSKASPSTYGNRYFFGGRRLS